MTKAKLYGNIHSFRTQKVLIAAKIGKKEVEVLSGSPPAEKFPLETTPAFEDNKTTLFGAVAISKHLASGNAQFLPEDPELDQWLFWGEEQLLPNVLSYVLPSISAADVDVKFAAQAKREFFAQLKAFDKVLASQTFLVGENLTLADVSVALNLLPAYQHVLDEKARTDLVNVTRWFQTVVNSSSVKEVVGDVKLATKASSFSADEFKKLSAASKSQKNGAPEPKKAEADDDFDLFDDDDDEVEETDEQKQIREKRLADYAAKKAKKPGPIAKSNIIYDVKPWDDTIDTKEIEANVRKIELEGLIWGASKILPVAFGINKLQICCVVEDEKVSTDWLEEQITGIEELVQSVDVVAFNKV